MPAPQASMMQQLARQKFTSFGITVPVGWRDPSGKAAEHYSKAFKDSEKSTAPGAPPLFQAASLNKYHTDTQKMLIAKFGSFIDGMCSALCSAWSTWQSSATMAGVVITGPVVSVGQLIGPPLMPLIMASAPKATPAELKYSTTIANVISTGWLAFTATIKISGFPAFPAYSALPTPVAPPMPHPPIPFASLVQVPTTITAAILKAQKIAMHGEPMAPHSKELFESIAYAFEQTYNMWKGTTMVTNLLAIATGGTPISPLPAVGTATMPPGGLV